MRHNDLGSPRPWLCAGRVGNGRGPVGPRGERWSVESEGVLMTDRGIFEGGRRLGEVPGAQWPPERFSGSQVLRRNGTSRLTASDS